MPYALNPTAILTRSLLQKKSISPHDAGCQDILTQRLIPLGFKVQRFHFGEVENLWAVREPLTSHPRAKERTLVFVGHTDVVPPGNLKNWIFDPFGAHVSKGKLYGRGTVDMKGALAAFVVACEAFLEHNPTTSLRIAFLVTSCEEVFREEGIQRMSSWLDEHHEPCPYILIGEPTSKKKVGDCVKKGRRGSLLGTLILQGKSGHVAYLNPHGNLIHIFIKNFSKVLQEDWGKGVDIFPPPSLHITSLISNFEQPEHHSQNVTADSLKCTFNIRFPPNLDSEATQKKIENFIKETNVKAHITWTLSGKPFLSQEGLLAQAIRHSLPEEPIFTADGGTSDGRFLARKDREIMELGLLSEKAHAVDEYVTLDDLEHLKTIYQKILENMNQYCS